MFMNQEYAYEWFNSYLNQLSFVTVLRITGAGPKQAQ